MIDGIGCDSYSARENTSNYNLIILCWKPGQMRLFILPAFAVFDTFSHCSPIHDHAGSHCIVKMLQGSLVEELFETPVHQKNECKETASAEASRPLTLRSRKEARKNDVSYIHDRIGLHRMRNDSPDECAISLHLYTPAYRKFRLFCEQSGQYISAECCPFYSIGGRVIGN